MPFFNRRLFRSRPSASGSSSRAASPPPPAAAAGSPVTAFPVDADDDEQHRPRRRSSLSLLSIFRRRSRPSTSAAADTAGTASGSAAGGGAAAAAAGNADRDADDLGLLRAMARSGQPARRAGAGSSRRSRRSSSASSSPGGGAAAAAAAAGAQPGSTHGASIDLSAILSSMTDSLAEAEHSGGLTSDPLGGFRRLRDDFLEAIALAVLDQHEVETAEAELKRLNNEQEVLELRNTLAELEHTYDEMAAEVDRDRSPASPATKEKLRQLESRVVISRLLLDASVASQKMMVLRARQQQQQNPHMQETAEQIEARARTASQLETELTLTLRTISSLRHNHRLMDILSETERQQSIDRRINRRVPQPVVEQGVPLAQQIACQKFHIACLRARVPGKLKIFLRRDNLFSESKRLLNSLAATQLKKRLCIVFANEEGRDFGGIAREWFQTLGAHLLTTGLEEGYLAYANANQTHVKISSDERPTRDVLEYFRLLGRVMGLALFHNKTLSMPWARPVLQLLLDRPLDVDHLQGVDDELHRNFKYLLENPGAEALDLTFTTEEPTSTGASRSVELRPYGSNIAVDDNNKAAYVELLMKRKFMHHIDEQHEELRSALYEVVPSDVFKDLRAVELELLLVGNPSLDVEDWRKHTQYDTYDESSPVVCWFWELVEEFSPQQRAQLLHFATGTSRLPVRGFAGLQGTHGSASFTIARNGVPESLPVGHTCSNRLDLPPYTSKEALQAKLLYAIEETEGFGIV